MKIGILAPPRLNKWQIRSLRNIQNNKDLSIEIIVVNSKARSDSSALAAESVNRGSDISLLDIKFFIHTIRKNRFRSLLYADQKIGAILFNEKKRLSNLTYTPVEEVDILKNVRQVECEPIYSEKNWMEIPEEVVEEVGNSCDVLLRFGFGLLKGEILTATDYGVLSAHGSDIRKYRGMGPRVTFLRKEEKVCVTLQQLTETIDGGRIVEIDCRQLEWPYTHDDIRGLIHNIQEEIFATGLKRLKANDQLPEQPSKLGEYYPHSEGQSARFVGKFLLQNNIARIKKYFKSSKIMS